MNGLWWYTRDWVNRRSRRALLGPRPPRGTNQAKYDHHYRQSWQRFVTHHWVRALREVFGDVVEAAEPVVVITTTPTEASDGQPRQS